MDIGGKFKLKYSADRPVQLVYFGRKTYLGDRRFWYRFAKAEKPDEVWCELLEEDLNLIEEIVTQPTEGESNETDRNLAFGSEQSF